MAQAFQDEPSKDSDNKNDVFINFYGANLGQENNNAPAGCPISPRKIKSESVTDFDLFTKSALTDILSPRDIAVKWSEIARRDTEQAVSDWIFILAKKMYSADCFINKRMTLDITEEILTRKADSGKNFPDTDNFIKREKAVINAVLKIHGWKAAHIVQNGESFELRVDWNASLPKNRELNDNTILDRINNPVLIDKLTRISEKLMYTIEDLDNELPVSLQKVNKRKVSKDKSDKVQSETVQRDLSAKNTNIAKSVRYAIFSMGSAVLLLGEYLAIPNPNYMYMLGLGIATVCTGLLARKYLQKNDSSTQSKYF